MAHQDPENPPGTFVGKSHSGLVLAGPAAYPINMKYLRIFPILIAGIFTHAQVASTTPMTAWDLFAAKVAISHTMIDLINALELSSQKRDDLVKTVQRRNAEHMTLPKVETANNVLMIKSSTGGTPLRIEVVDAAARKFKVNGQSLTLNEKWNSEQVLSRMERLVRGDQTISLWNLLLPRAEAVSMVGVLLVGLLGLLAVVAWGNGLFKGDLAAKIIKISESSSLKIRLKSFACKDGRLSEFAIEQVGNNNPSQTASFEYETHRNGTIKYSTDDFTCNFDWTGANYTISSASATEASPAANEFCQGLAKDSSGKLISAKQLELFATAGLETLRDCASDEKCCKAVQAHIQKSTGSGSGNGGSSSSK